MSTTEIINRISALKSEIIAAEAKLSLLKFNLTKEKALLQKTCSHTEFDEIYNHDPCSYGYYYLCKVCSLNKDYCKS